MPIRDTDRLTEAAAIAARHSDRRTYLVGAVAVRRDGALVRSRNGAPKYPNQPSHAEARLAAKLDVGATVWVARITRGGIVALAKPCPNCETLLRRRGVRRVIYTTGPDSYGVMDL